LKKKTVKVASASWAPLANGFVSSAKYALLPSKINKITIVNVLLLLLPHFYT